MSSYKTEQRRQLLEYLCTHSQESLTARGIHGGLGPEQISLSAVYRNLAALEQDGQIRRVTLPGSREAAYQYVGGGACRAHLHLNCTGCGRTIHMAESETEALVRTVAQLDGFAIDKTETVLYGLCESCQGKGPKK